MRINALAQRLRDALGAALEISDEEADKVVASYEADCGQAEKRLIELVRKHVGIVPAGADRCAQQRLNSLRLETSYPGVREARLRKVVLDQRSIFAELLGPLVTAMIKLEFAEIELEMEAERTERVRIAKSQHLRDGIYDDVAVAADRLHETCGATYNHWKVLSDHQLQDIADVLIR